MSKQTPLFNAHLALNAKMVDFAGWSMPLHYGSQLNEHQKVRHDVGLFDVSHMGVIDVKGAGTLAFLRFVLANDVAKLKNKGDALYSCLLNPQGGVIDDLIAYRLSEDYFRLVVNAGCRDKDYQWLTAQTKSFEVTLSWRDDLCLLALQGPNALDHLSDCFDATVVQQVKSLKPFQSLCVGNTVIARTGYTGEAGVEIMLPDDQAVQMWNCFIEHGVQPCGLGARDTLRLEAGYNLYGHDMTETTSPWISNLSWTVALKDETRDFIGKKALLEEKNAGVSQQLIGLRMLEKGVMRDHQKVKLTDTTFGEITSGGFSPTLGYSIAMARVPKSDAVHAFVERRDQWVQVEIVSLPFVKQ